jgi:hypothetical protein
MKREILTSLIRTAGYHNDSRSFARLLVENRISYHAAHEAYRSGQQARAVGVRCDCHECKAVAS